MSPVSRGRGKKNRSSKGPKGSRAAVHARGPLTDGFGPPSEGFGPSSEGFGPSSTPTRPSGARTGEGLGGAHPQRGALDAIAALARSLPGSEQMMAQARAWWPASHEQVLDAASVLLACAAPSDLEDAVCDLLGRHWAAAREEHETGFDPTGWLEALIGAAADRATSPVVRRLLYGIAAITTPGLASAASDLLRRTAPAGDEPAWLAKTPAVLASSDILLLRDVYGLRFGILVPITGPDRPDRTYLFDIDLCHGSYEVLTSGYHPDVPTAAAAWRRLVGASAAVSEPAPAPAELLPHVLPGAGTLDGFIGRPLTATHFTELYRGDRIVHEAADALENAGRPVEWTHDTAEAASDRAADLAEQFRSWAGTVGVELPDDELLSWMLNDWTFGLPGDLSLACSPHRIAAFTAYLADDWKDEQRARALALLEPWARYCLERTGITGEAAEQTLDWARRAAHDTQDVAGDLGNDPNRPIDETTVQSPPAPAD